MGLPNQRSVRRWCDSIFVSTLAACAVTWCPAVARAQAAPAAAPAPPPPAYEGSAEFAFLGTTGNASAQTIGVGGELILRPEKWVVRNKAAFMRNKTDGVLTAKVFQYLIRGERLLTPRTAAFGQDTYFQDRFAGVAHRNSLLGGVAFKLIDRASHLLSVDGGLGYLNEERLTGDDVSSASYAFGGAYRWKLSPTAEFSDDARYTATFDDASDWRVDQTLAIVARLTSLFSLKASNSVRYANTPVPGFKNTDTNTAIALVAKF
jgi:putative salt-induced outer membrane protein YdiY